jgi:hypothetical protein
MGNNMNNILCNNYYCQPISFKPEWFSKTSWEIKSSLEDIDGIDDKNYIINKGILKIENIQSSYLLLSKKLLLSLEDINNISIPLFFHYNIIKENEYIISILFSKELIKISDIKNINTLYSEFKKNNLIFQLKLFNNYCYLLNKKKIVKKKINSKKDNIFDIKIENNVELLLIKNKLYNKDKVIYETSFIENFKIKDDVYLHIFIQNKKDMLENEYVELNL